MKQTILIQIQDPTAVSLRAIVQLSPGSSSPPSAIVLRGLDGQAVRRTHRPDRKLVQREQISGLPLCLLASGQRTRSKTCFKLVIFVANSLLGMLNIGQISK